MRPVTIFTLVAALGSIALLAARAGGAPVPISRVPNVSARTAAVLQAGHRGAFPYAVCTGQRARRLRTPSLASSMYAAALPSYLYVVDACGSVVDVLHAGTYREDGYISNGLSAPGDAFVDAKGNLFVANVANGNNGSAVVEYAPGNANAPSFIYSANMVDPQAVATDIEGNLYEGDVSGIINEYYPNRNISIASCQPINNGDASQVDGVAVDKNNDVFATIYDVNAGLSELVEYPGGLTSCGGLEVLLSVNYILSGIAVDKNADLLVTFDFAPGVSSGVAVVDPPYTTFDGLIGGTGFQGVHSVKLSRSNKLAFVTDEFAGTVTVVNYPTGTIVTALGAPNGLSEPVSAVEQPNAVY